MKMKRILSVLLSFVLICTLFATNVFAASASFTLTASSSVTVGNQVKVTVKLSSAEKIGSWRFSVSYDPAVLEYVSGADSGGGGAVSFADSSDGTTSFSKTIVFRAKKIGSATVSVVSAQVVSFDTASNMTVNTPSRKINVVAAPNLSAENQLSELSVSAGELTPAFASEVAEYAVSVPYETTTLSVFATAKDAKAAVSVTPIETLAVGENKIEVVVTAENGSKRTYTLTVTRAESELAGVTAELDGVTYQVAYDASALTVPSNYTPTTVPYGEKKILVFSAPRDTLKIAYLFTEESGSWYVFDTENQSFTEYLSVTDTSKTLVLLTPPESVEIPEGFLPHSITVGEKEWSVYKAQNSEEDGIWLVYAMNGEGLCEFFYYDQNLDTFFSYFEPAKDTAAEEAAEKEKANLESLLDASEEKADQMEILFLAAATGATLLLIFLIAALIFIKKSKATGSDAKPQASTVPKRTEEPAPEEGEKNVHTATVASVEEPAAEVTEPTEGSVPEADAPKKRRAKRTLDDIGRKESSASPAEEAEKKEEKEDVSAPASAEQTAAENKRHSDFDDIPPILR